jgi:hypothetical protein
MDRAFSAAWLALTFAAAAPAQITGDLRGTIRDAAGGSVSNARLTLVSLDTGARRAAFTDVAGRFSFNLLMIGDYVLTAEAQGFRRSTSRANVRSAEIVTANLTLEVGAVNEEVTVTDSPPALDLQSSQSRHSIRPNRCMSCRWRATRTLSPALYRASYPQWAPSIPAASS